MSFCMIAKYRSFFRKTNKNPGMLRVGVGWVMKLTGWGGVGGS